jgi:hypothetical protein
MASTQIRGLQLRLGTIPRNRIDAAFEASLANIESNVADIYSTMSTDTERMAAITALTLAFENADTTLQSAIISLINATKAGAGLESNGTLVLGTTNYLGSSASLKLALLQLDTALKAEETARSTADATLQSQLTAATAAGLTYANYVNRETPTGSVDGSNLKFTLLATPSAGTESVFLNGLLQEPGISEDYTLAGAEISFNVAPEIGDRIKASYFR